MVAIGLAIGSEGGGVPSTPLHCFPFISSLLLITAFNNFILSRVRVDAEVAGLDAGVVWGLHAKP